MYVRLFLAISLGLSLALASCTESDQSADDSPAIAQSSDSAAATTRNPVGRTVLPTWNTPAPDLTIDLSGSYVVRADSNRSDDLIFIEPEREESERTTMNVPTGILRIYVGDSVMAIQAPGEAMGERKSIVGGVPATWKLYRMTGSNSRALYSRELFIRNFLAVSKADRELRSLNLHLFVAGNDSTIVEDLTEIARTLSWKP